MGGKTGPGGPGGIGPNRAVSGGGGKGPAQMATGAPPSPRLRPGTQLTTPAVPARVRRLNRQLTPDMPPPRPRPLPPATALNTPASGAFPDTLTGKPVRPGGRDLPGGSTSGLIYDPATGKMVDPRTGLPPEAVLTGGI